MDGALKRLLKHSDLAAAFAKNAPARDFFETLTGGNRYAILYSVQTAKKPETRAERNVERLYDLARQTTLGYEGYARRLAKRYRRCTGGEFGAGVWYAGACKSFANASNNRCPNQSGLSSAPVLEVTSPNTRAVKN